MPSLFHDKILIFMFISFCLLIQLIYLNRRAIKSYLVKTDRITWIALAAIFVSAFIIRVFIAPLQHIMYIDEAWYMEAAKNIIQHGHQGNYSKSIGWPFILAPFFAVFGINNWVALYASVFLGSLTVLSVFFMTFILTDKKNVSLLSAFLISLYSPHIRWSASAVTNVASVFFLSLAVFFMFIYFRKKKLSLLWLSLAGITVAAQIRPENHILFFLLIFGCLLFKTINIKQISINFFLPWVTFIALCIPNLLGIQKYYSSVNHLEKESGGIIAGSNWSLSNLIDNSRDWGAYVFNGEFQPAFMLCFIILGFVLMFLKGKRELLFLITWFLLLWIGFFSHWLQTQGESMTNVWAKSRLFISFYPILGLLAAYGISWSIGVVTSKIRHRAIKFCVSSIAIILLMLSFIPYLEESSRRFSGDAHLLETKIPELAEKDIPSHCTIVANYPTILKSSTELNVVDAGAFLNDRSRHNHPIHESECVLFFEDLTCELWDFSREICRKIKNNFRMQEFKVYTEGDTKYSFYRIYDRKL